MLETNQQLEEQKTPYTWAHLKKFCNSLSDDQLPQNVVLIQPDEESSINVLHASDLGEDHYKFDDEEYSIMKGDFDPEYHFDGKYKTFEDALANEPYSLIVATRVYLYSEY